MRTFVSAIVLFLCFVGSLNALVNLRATRESQIIQNERADADQLTRLQDNVMLERFVRLKLLEPVAPRALTYYLHKIRPSHRFLRPWSKLFLVRLSRQYRARFNKPLRVTSLVRTAAYQKSLRRRNGNAASAFGTKRSTHLTGAGLDISKKGMRRAEVAWMRRVLHSLKVKGYIFPVEEFKQPNFHVMVFRSYPDYVEKLVAAAAKSR